MGSIDTIRFKEPARTDYLRRLARKVGTVASMLWHLAERRKTRIDLFELSDEQLKDIGISRADAYREATRWLLDPPLYSIDDGRVARSRTARDAGAPLSGS